MVLRKMGNSVTPTCYLEKVGDTYEFHTTSTFKSSVIKFKPGVEFEEETLDGRKVMATITFEGDNKLVQDQKGEKPSVITRVFTDTELVTTMTLGDLVSTRYYKVV
jgi:fatty acid-binding protein 3, muscle and heart